jgi:hypothetical protein
MEERQGDTHLVISRAERYLADVVFVVRRTAGSKRGILGKYGSFGRKSGC